MMLCGIVKSELERTRDTDIRNNNFRINIFLNEIAKNEITIFRIVYLRFYLDLRLFFVFFFAI